jgi:hypothetical protein
LFPGAFAREAILRRKFPREVTQEKLRMEMRSRSCFAAKFQRRDIFLQAFPRSNSIESRKMGMMQE